MGDNRQVARTLGLVALVLFSSVVPFLAFGVGVQTAAADTQVIESYEGGTDGNAIQNGWEYDSSDAFEGSLSALQPAADDQNSGLGVNPAAATPSITRFAYQAETLTGDGSTRIGTASISGTDGKIIQFRIMGDGSVEWTNDGSTYTDTGYDITAGEWYRFGLDDIDYANDVTDIIIQKGGSTVHRTSSVSWWVISSSNDDVDSYSVVTEPGSPAQRVDYFTQDGATVYNSFSGTVTDSDGNPIENATVVVDGRTDKTATTNASGVYTFSSLKDGSHTFTAVRAGYTDSQRTVDTSTTSAADLQLAKTSGSTVTVENLNGDTLAGARVSVFDSTNRLEETFTDGTGKATIETSGSYRLVAEAPGYATDGKDVSLSDGSTHTLVLGGTDSLNDGYASNITDPVVGGNVSDLENATFECSVSPLEADTGAGLLNDDLGVFGAGFSTSVGVTDQAIRTVNDAGEAVLCKPDYQAQTRIDLLAAAAGVNQANQELETVINNRLTDAKQVAYTEGKIAAIRALNNNATKAEARQAFNESVNAYYSTIINNLLTRYTASVAQGEYIVQTEKSSTGSTNTWIKPVVGGSNTTFSTNVADGTKTVLVTLPDGTQKEVTTWVSSDGTVASPAPSMTDDGAAATGPKLRVTGPNGRYTDMVDTDRFNTLITNVENQRTRVNDNGATVVNNVYSNFTAGELDASDLLSPSELAGQAATNYSETGYYSYAAAELAALGQAGSLNHSHTIERYDGTTLSGTLFYTGAPSDVTFSLGDTYDPDAQQYTGEFLMATNDGVIQLTKPFTIKEQVNVRTGETVGNVEPENYTYGRTSAVDLKEFLADAQQVRQAYDDAAGPGIGFPDLSAFSLFGLPGIVVVGAAAVGGLLLLTRN